MSDVVVVRTDGRTVDDPAVQAAVERLASELGAVVGIQRAATWYDTQIVALVAPDRRATLIALTPGPDTADRIPEVYDVVERNDGRAGMHLAVTGELTVDEDFSTLSEEDLQKGELFFGMPAALVVLVLVFGALVTALVPLLLAIVAIIVALALTALVGQQFELSIYVVNMLTGMGLALGIDYSLFVVSRYREERVDGRERLNAIDVAGQTACRAVGFSGSAFVLAMLGMVLVPDTILRSLAVGAILVGITSVAAALTLLPAVLALLGDRGERAADPAGRTRCRPREPAVGQGRARRDAPARRQPRGRRVGAAPGRRPGARPRDGQSGIRTLPDRFPRGRGSRRCRTRSEWEPSTRQRSWSTATSRLRASGWRSHGCGAFAAPRPRVRDLVRRHVPRAAPRRRVGARARRQSRPGGARGRAAHPQRGRARRLPRHRRGRPRHGRDGRGDRLLRADRPLAAHRLRLRARAELRPADARVPQRRDRSEGDRAQPAVRRRRLRPARARVREGRGNELFGFEQVETIEAWVPLFLFSVLFGLSMDYHVFLLSRIRERYAETGDNNGSIASASRRRPG